MLFADLYHVTGSMWYMHMVAGVVLLQLPFFFWIRSHYVYRADRPALFPSEMKQGDKHSLSASNITIIDIVDSRQY